MKVEKSMIVCLGLAVLMLAGGPAFGAAAAKAEKPGAKQAKEVKAEKPKEKPAKADKPDLSLENGDCGKCHMEAPRDIEAAGMRHKTSVACMDCHDGHPPVKYDIIPACSACHSGTAHFELKECLSCHSNPHRPLELKLTKDITGPCLTCHEEPGKELNEFPSVHTSLACTACHNTHGEVPECNKCHQPHAPTMVQADCRMCHKPHKPLVIAYADTVPSASCGACHGDVSEILAKSQAKHTGVACASCHVQNHGAIPQCSQCHQPHGPDMTAAECRLCHQAHSPMPVAYGNNVPSVSCGACHGDVQETLAAGQTRHQKVACVSCHQATHGNIPTCGNCHEPHSAEMAQTDCVQCHQAHRPAPVHYGLGVPSQSCGACHGDALQVLQASDAKHRELLCVTCHQKEHKMIPTCQECHSAPHSERMMTKFASCADCHGTAHSLIH